MKSATQTMITTILVKLFSFILLVQLLCVCVSVCVCVSAVGRCVAALLSVYRQSGRREEHKRTLTERCLHVLYVTPTALKQFMKDWMLSFMSTLSFCCLSVCFYGLSYFDTAAVFMIKLLRFEGFRQSRDAVWGAMVSSTGQKKQQPLKRPHSCRFKSFLWTWRWWATVTVILQ